MWWSEAFFFLKELVICIFYYNYKFLFITKIRSCCQFFYSVHCRYLKRNIFYVAYKFVIDNFLLSIIMDSLSTYTSEEPEQTFLAVSIKVWWLNFCLFYLACCIVLSSALLFILFETSQEVLTKLWPKIDSWNTWS